MGHSVAMAGLGAASFSGRSALGERPVAEGSIDEEERRFRALREGDRLDTAGPVQQIVERAFQLGKDLEKKHGGCARCTVAALQEATEFLPRDAGLLRAASVLDGGATPKGVQNCGAFTGAGMFIGWLCGTENFENPGLARKLIRQVYRKFEKEYGTVLCKDVRAKAGGDCPEVVALAARWTAQALLTQFAGDKKKGL